MADLDLDADRPCCDGAANRGIRYCTCWRDELNGVQAPWNGTLPEVRPSCCGDCASLPDSPERTWDDGSRWDEVVRMARAGRGVFVCHRGTNGAEMLRMVRTVNTVDGRVTVPDGDAYRPAEVSAQGLEFSLLADGSPAPICAAFAALCRKHGHDPMELLRTRTPDPHTTEIG